MVAKRLKIIGIPVDDVDLIKIWLEDRSFYVSIDGKNSMLVELLCGTVQGSILGPILYVSPLFDLHNLTNFANRNFIAWWNRHMPELIAKLESSLEAITKWFRGSGLAVNDSKTVLCLSHWLDQPSIKIKSFNSETKSTNKMNILEGHFRKQTAVVGAIFKCNSESKSGTLCYQANQKILDKS
jgi:hypothetical protein